MFTRYLEHHITADLTKGKILIIYGARQVGKTTLVRRFIDSTTLYLNADQAETRTLLTTQNLSTLRSLIGSNKRLIIDEAQRIPEIGLTLKIIHDNFPTLQCIVTGSSALELSERLAEPLTGRFLSYLMYPLSIREIAANRDLVALREELDSRLIYGSYPEIVTTQTPSDKERLLKGLVESYILKDLLMVATIRQPEHILKLLQAVALQIGSELSYEEVAQTLGIHKQTVERYLTLLERVFVLFSLRPFSTNQRQSIKKKRKYYFYDVGIRNALLNNFNPLDVRSDRGGLWENWCIAEIKKRNDAEQKTPNYYFWRSYTQQEIDLMEEYNGVINGFEIKYGRPEVPRATQKAFQEMGGKNLQAINRENVWEKLL